MTLLVPVFMFGILAFQTFLIAYNGENSATLLIISESSELTNSLRKDFGEMSLVKNGKYKIDFETESKSEIKNKIDGLKNKLLADKLTGVVFIPSTALKDKRIEYYSKNPGNNDLFQKLRGTINQALVDNYFNNKQLSKADIEYARDRVDFNGFRISSDKEVKQANDGATIISMVFSFILYFSLMFIGMMMMRSVVEEKNSKIVELLLSSVKAKELMTGKII
jgi:ABC-2 type transport system permease protein